MNKVDIMDRSVHQLTTSNTAMEATVQTLHEGQLMMDNSINMLMIKLGIQTGSASNSATPNNEKNRAAYVTEANELSSWIQVNDKRKHDFKICNYPLPAKIEKQFKSSKTLELSVDMVRSGP